MPDKEYFDREMEPFGIRLADIRDKQLLELRATIEHERGHKVAIDTASSRADRWLLRIDETWKIFVDEQNELLDHIWGKKR